MYRDGSRGRSGRRTKRVRAKVRRPEKRKENRSGSKRGEVSVGHQKEATGQGAVVTRGQGRAGRAERMDQKVGRR